VHLVEDLEHDQKAEWTLGAVEHAVFVVHVAGHDFALSREIRDPCRFQRIRAARSSGFMVEALRRLEQLRLARLSGRACKMEDGRLPQLRRLSEPAYLRKYPRCARGNAAKLLQADPVAVSRDAVPREPSSVVYGKAERTVSGKNDLVTSQNGSASSSVLSIQCDRREVIYRFTVDQSLNDPLRGKRLGQQRGDSRDRARNCSPATTP